MELSFAVNTKIYIGMNSLQTLKNVKGTKALIVSDNIMKDLGYLDQTKKILEEGGISCITFTDVKPDPDLSIVQKGLSIYMEHKVDLLIALGGGSVIDTAKGILYYFNQTAPFLNGTQASPTFVAIPSTSGTGSEVTSFSIITHDGEKLCLISQELAPDIAILDSTCIRNVPKQVYANTGIDVLVHCIEAYVSKGATIFSDALAEKAFKLLFEYLPKAYKNIDDNDARDTVLYASCLAGMAFDNAGLGINHSLAHSLGATFGIAHGRANALLLKSVIQYNAEIKAKADSETTERYRQLASLIGLPARTKREGTFSLITAIEGLKSSLGIETAIKHLGISRETFESKMDAMASSAIQDRCTPSNPLEPTKMDLIEIYRSSF